MNHLTNLATLISITCLVLSITYGYYDLVYPFSVAPLILNSRVLINSGQKNKSCK